MDFNINIIKNNDMKILDKNKEVLKVVLIYAIFGFGWVFFSDTVSSGVVRDRDIATAVSFFKGSFFIIVTSFLLYFLINRLNNRIKQSANAQRESEELLRFFIKNSSDTLVIIDSELQQRYVSSGAQKVFGYSVSELQGKTLDEIIHPDDMQDIKDAWRVAIEHHEKVVTVRYRHIHKDGGWVFAEAVAQNFLHEPAVNGIMASVRDITKRKVAEKELMEKHELLENLARLVPGVIYQYRLFPDGRSAFPYASPGVADIYELSPDDILDDAMPVFNRMYPEDHDRFRELLQESARTMSTLHCELRVVLPRQGLRWCWSQAEPQQLEDGGVLWHGITLDITDRKKEEAQTEKLRDQLVQAQKMESVGRLAGGVAHDFNNMLAVILGYSQMALLKVGDDHHLRSALQEIQTAGKRSADLTRQLLAFARKQTVSPKVLDLNVTVEGMLKMLKRLIGEDIDLVYAPAEDLCKIKMDPSQIDQVLVNLCVNARDAIKDTGKITIATSNIFIDGVNRGESPCVDPGKYVLLTVSDNGCGMDQETYLHLFEPFFTTKPKGEGTGLGLATIYGIVKQNRGFIAAQSTAGQGTTFKIYLPCNQAKGSPAVKSDTKKILDNGHGTVLLVEDEPMVLEMTRRMLVELGYNVLSASTPGEAISLAQDHNGEIDLVVTDVVMPEMNGRDLVKNLLSRYPNLKRLFMSGYTADVIAHHGVLDEGVHFIQKPFTMDDLALKIREALDL